jgi:hypothetical protein
MQHTRPPGVKINVGTLHIVSNHAAGLSTGLLPVISASAVIDQQSYMRIVGY